MPKHRRGLSQANRAKLKRTKAALESRRIRDGRIEPLMKGHISDVRVTAGAGRYPWPWPIPTKRPSVWERITDVFMVGLEGFKRKWRSLFGRKSSHTTNN